MPAYTKYSHVRRYGTEGTEGYLKGHVIATPKVDGANCCVFFDDAAGKARIGGRKTVCEDRKDCSWLGEWFEKDAAEAPHLREFVGNHPNLVIYGEWMGGVVKDKFQGAIKDYDKEHLRTVKIFDVFDTDTETYLEDHEWREMIDEHYPELSRYCVPILAEFDDPTEEQLWEVAEKNTYMLDEAEHAGEGIVIRNPAFKDEYGNYHIVKMVLSDWQQRANKRAREAVEMDVEAAIVHEYMTDAEMEKTVQKTCAKFGDEKFDSTSRKHMGFFTSVIFRDLLEENIMDMMKRFKKPIIDFGRLSGLATKRGEEYLREAGLMGNEQRVGGKE